MLNWEVAHCLFHRCEMAFCSIGRSSPENHVLPVQPRDRIAADEASSRHTVFRSDAACDTVIVEVSPCPQPHAQREPRSRTFRSKNASAVALTSSMSSAAINLAPKSMTGSRPKKKRRFTLRNDRERRTDTTTCTKPVRRTYGD